MSRPGPFSFVARSPSLIAGVAALFTLLTLFAPALAGLASPARAAASSEEIEEKHSPVAAAHTDRRCKSHLTARRAAAYSPPPSDRTPDHQTLTRVFGSRGPAASGHLIPLRC